MSATDIVVVAGGAAAFGAAIFALARWVGPTGSGGSGTSRDTANTERLRAEGAASARASGGDLY